MTWETTHIALESAFIYIFLPKEKRERYSIRKKDWFYISLFAMFPDLDVFFGIHRSVSHSFVVVALFGLLTVITLKGINKYTPDWSRKHEVLKDAIVLFPWFWALHLILDLGFGPLQLFYPLSKAFFNVSFDLLVSLKPLGPIPIVPYGITINFEMLSETAGLKSFVINMSYEQRLALYGTSKVSFEIYELPVHAFLFIGWTYWLTKDSIAEINRKIIFPKKKIPLTWEKTGKIFLETLKVLAWLWLIGISSLLAYNSIPSQNRQEGFAYWNVTLVSEKITPIQLVEANFPNKDTKPEIWISFPSSKVNLTLGLLIISEKNRNIDTTPIIKLVSSWNGSFTSEPFRKNYTSIINGIQWANLILPVELKNTPFVLNKSNFKTNYMLIGIVLLDWEINSSFVKTGEIKISYSYDQSNVRDFFLRVGLISLFSPVIVSIFSGFSYYLFLDFFRKKRLKE